VSVCCRSHELYDKYKVARTVREMLALGGRRGDVAYDVSHGWITFVDPDIARRCAGAAARPLEHARSRYAVN
jgi:hypothetical protein